MTAPRIPTVGLITGDQVVGCLLSWIESRDMLRLPTI